MIHKPLPPRGARALAACMASAFTMIAAGLVWVCIEQGRNADTTGWALVWAGVTMLPVMVTLFLAFVTWGLWREVGR